MRNKIPFILSGVGGAIVFLGFTVGSILAVSLGAYLVGVGVGAALTLGGSAMTTDKDRAEALEWVRLNAPYSVYDALEAKPIDDAEVQELVRLAKVFSKRENFKDSYDGNCAYTAYFNMIAVLEAPDAKPTDAPALPKIEGLAEAIFAVSTQVMPEQTFFATSLGKVLKAAHAYHKLSAGSTTDECPLTEGE